MARATTSAIASLLLAAAAHAQQPPPAPAPDGTPVSAHKPLAERLAAQRAALDASIARCEAFGHREEFAAALRKLQSEHAEIVDGKERWAQVARGWLPLMAIDHWVDWHLPAEGRPVPRALDVDRIENHPFPTIVDMARQLAAHQIDFVLVLFPSRVQLYPELVLPELEGKLGPEFPGMVDATTRFLRALNEEGVETVDLAPAFVVARAPATPEDGELYLQRNKHWTPRASQLAARVVADHLRTLEWFEPGPYHEGTDFEIVTRAAPFGSTAGGQAPDATQEKLNLQQVRTLGERPNPALARRSPIVVLGDSFAKFYLEHNACFADQLRRSTGHPIDAIMPMGGAEIQCRETIARRGDNLRGKKVVVWLMQEDNLKLGPQFRKVTLFDGTLPPEKGDAPAKKDGK